MLTLTFIKRFWHFCHSVISRYPPSLACPPPPRNFYSSWSCSATLSQHFGHTQPLNVTCSSADAASSATSVFKKCLALMFVRNYFNELFVGCRLACLDCRMTIACPPPPAAAHPPNLCHIYKFTHISPAFLVAWQLFHSFFLSFLTLCVNLINCQPRTCHQFISTSVKRGWVPLGSV